MSHTFTRLILISVCPRYAIPVARLQQGFKDMSLAAAVFSCRPSNP